MGGTGPDRNRGRAGGTVVARSLLENVTNRLFFGRLSTRTAIAFGVAGAGGACVIALLERGDDASDGHKSHGGLGKLCNVAARVFWALRVAGPAFRWRCAFVNIRNKIRVQKCTYGNGRFMTKFSDFFQEYPDPADVFRRIKDVALGDVSAALFRRVVVLIFSTGRLPKTRIYAPPRLSGSAASSFACCIRL